MRPVLLTAALVAVFAVLTGRAWDHEYGLSERAAGAATGPRSESLYQGRSARWWARRAVQARKDANARGRTIRRLRATLERGLIPWYWIRVGSCESGLRWHYDGPSGFDGALQFHPGTWSAYRLPSYPRLAWQASPFQQLVVAEIVLAAQGWRAWPACSRKVGLR